MREGLAKSIFQDSMRKAATASGLSPELKLRRLEPTGDPVDIYFIRAIAALGLAGEVFLFGRGRGGQVIGVPMNTANSSKFYTGVYLPKEGEDVGGLQEKFDGIVEDIKRKKRKGFAPRFADPVLVATPEVVRVWSKEWGAIKLPQRALGYEGDLDVEARERARRWGDKYMQTVYFPAMIGALSVMGDHGLYPSEIVGGTSVLKRLNGDLVSVDFGSVISTDHSTTLREMVLARDRICRFPGSWGYQHDFKIEELVYLYENVASFRDGNDPKRDLMGVDMSGVEIRRKPDPVQLPMCGRHFEADYLHIPPGAYRLDPQARIFDFHHIVPRGAAYTLLLTGLLLDERLAERSVAELALWMRGVKIGDLVSTNKSYLFADREKVLTILARQILAIDRVVNSPYNAVALCPQCHREIIHPDMPHAVNIARFLQAVQNIDIRIRRPGDGRLKDQIQECSKAILTGIEASAPIDYTAVMRWLHIARRLVLAQGIHYWENRYTDRLLDYARGATRRFLKGHEDMYGAWGIERRQTNLQTMVDMENLQLDGEPYSSLVE